MDIALRNYRFISTVITAYRVRGRNDIDHHQYGTYAALFSGKYSDQMLGRRASQSGCH